MTDLFEQRLRKAVRSLPSPEAPRSVIDRVLADRAAGARIILPAATTARSASRRWRTMTMVGVAAGVAAVGLTLTLSAPRRSSPVAAVDSPSSSERLFVSSGVFPANAYAQTPPPAPGAPPLTGVNGLGLGGRRFEYRTQFVDSAGRVTPDGDGVVQFSDAHYEGAPAWRVSHIANVVSKAGQRRVMVETLFVARRDLRLLARSVREAPYLRFSQITIRQRFVGDSVLGEMSSDNGIRRPIARQLPAAFGPYLSDALAPLGLLGVPLSSRWRASVSIVGWAVVPTDVFYPATLRVIGEERLSTASGLVDCWKLRVVAGTQQRTEWVRKSDGLALRSRDESPPGPKGYREFVVTDS